MNIIFGSLMNQVHTFLKNLSQYNKNDNIRSEGQEIRESDEYWQF